MIEIAFVIFAVSHAIVIMFFERQRKEIALLNRIIKERSFKTNKT